MALKSNQESESQVKIIITPGAYYWWAKNSKEKEKQKKGGEREKEKKAKQNQELKEVTKEFKK